MLFGTYIKIYRKQVKLLSQKDLANQVRVSPQFIHDIEHNRRTPSDKALLRLQSILGFDLDYGNHLLGKLPPDLTGNVSKAKLKKAYKIMREK